MNMQNKLYAIPFSHHLMTDSHIVLEQRSQNLENSKFCEFHETPEKDQTPVKVQTPTQERIQTHRNEKQQIPAPWPTPIHKLSRSPWYGIFALASLVWLAVLPPSSCTPAH